MAFITSLYKQLIRVAENTPYGIAEPVTEFQKPTIFTAPEFRPTGEFGPHKQGTGA